MIIVPGEIVVAEAVLMLDEAHVRVWHVDLESKYAQILTYSGDRVLLIADERTRGVDEDRRGLPTTLQVGLPERWSIIADCSRYTCRVVGYRPRP